MIGQQKLGKLVSHEKGGCKSWWLLPVVVGYAIQIDPMVQSHPYIQLDMYTPGANDFNYPQTQERAGGHTNENHKAQLHYQTPPLSQARAVARHPARTWN